MIIGIDPGQTGSLAFYEDGKITAIEDMPVMARTHGQGQQVDPYALATLIMEHGGTGSNDYAQVMEYAEIRYRELVEAEG